MTDAPGEGRAMLYALGATFAPIGTQALWLATLPSDSFMLGLPVSVALGGALVWQIPKSQRMRVVVLILYVFVYGPLLFIGSLGWHISRHGF